VDGILIFLMTSLGMMTSASAMQGYLVCRTNILDRILLLAATIPLVFPYLVTGFFLPYEMRWWGYPIGVAITVLVWVMQVLRMKANPALRPA